MKRTYVINERKHLYDVQQTNLNQNGVYFDKASGHNKQILHSLYHKSRKSSSPPFSSLHQQPTLRLVTRLQLNHCCSSVAHWLSQQTMLFWTNQMVRWWFRCIFASLSKFIPRGKVSKEDCLTVTIIFVLAALLDFCYEFRVYRRWLRYVYF